ncbi:MAG TPA: ABC transporter substrate-binding protein, partial [Pseudobdellovibrionaceae bacterium]|nr:ABC transporter substrate-binding protein [Pseudobdellovibrionaceae bacterium]
PRSAIYKKQGDKPFGTGAWEILSSDQDIVRFKRNPNYFLGSPKCENLHLIKIPQDEELAAIQSKKVDFVDYFSPELKKSEFLKAPIFPKELNVISVPTYDVMLLFFTNGTSHSLSPSERQWIFQKLIGNKSFNINSSVNFACNILPKGIGFNSIDFCRMDFRSKPNSIRPKSDLALYGPNDQRNVFMTMIADRLAQFRINTSTIGLPINEIFKLHKEKKIALHIETVTMQVPDPYGLLSMYESGSPEKFSNYNNPKFDRVLNQATESLSKEVRVRLYDQAIKILARDFMIIPLVNQSRYVVANSKVKGLSAQSMGPYYSNYHSLYKLVN